jgi:hypothetical protein
VLGMKHSFCFNSIASKAQPSESIPMKKDCRGWKSTSFWAA